MPDLPITPALPQITTALARGGVAVLQAPPGAGKTTLVPLAVMQSGVVEGKIIVLEPRRLAARGAAERMAQLLGENVGHSVGYRMRGQSRVSAATRIEVVTEGILNRQIQADPELTGIGALLFDEFHERSLNADLGLALAWDIRQALRPDLNILVMSATLDAQPIADMLNAPIITTQGRSFPVETRWLDRAPPRDTSLESAAAALVEQALVETEGSILTFLPGEAEIRRTQSLLKRRLGPQAIILPLYGALPFEDQRRAIAPLRSGRKIVLATSIAETSLTIEDVRVVVDAGRARQPILDVARGMSRLVTRAVTKAEAEQRRGRAGRVAPGWCYRMWMKSAEGALPAYPSPEIVTGDLAGFALDLAQWGGSPDTMAFLTPPDPASLAAAQALLVELGALDAGRLITDHGRAMAQVPVHPRLAHMLVRAGKGAAPVAAVLSDLGALPRDACDLARAIASPGPVFRREIARFEKLAGPDQGLSRPQALALAYPDRIGKRRPGSEPRYVLTSGSGARLQGETDLATAPYIVAPDLDGAGREPKIRRALAITEPELREFFGDRITWQSSCNWSARDRKILAVRRETLGQMVLRDLPWTDAPEDAFRAAAAQGIRALGLPFSKKARLFQARARIARDVTNGPDLSDTTLLDTLENWLLPMLDKTPRTEADIRALDILPALKAMFDWRQMAHLDRAAPQSFTAPTGRKCQIDYTAERAEISIKLQEMFGLTQHPMVGQHPLSVTLLSPAGRPLQTTSDIPGFWANSYADVRRDMRGRYPKHPWPEDPAQAMPTARAKPRKS